MRDSALLAPGILLFRFIVWACAVVDLPKVDRFLAVMTNVFLLFQIDLHYTFLLKTKLFIKQLEHSIDIKQARYWACAHMKTAVLDVSYLIHDMLKALGGIGNAQKSCPFTNIRGCSLDAFNGGAVVNLSNLSCVHISAPE